MQSWHLDNSIPTCLPSDRLHKAALCPCAPRILWRPWLLISQEPKREMWNSETVKHVSLQVFNWNLANCSLQAAPETSVACHQQMACCYFLTHFIFHSGSCTCIPQGIWDWSQSPMEPQGKPRMVPGTVDVFSKSSMLRRQKVYTDLSTYGYDMIDKELLEGSKLQMGLGSWGFS